MYHALEGDGMFLLEEGAQPCRSGGTTGSLNLLWVKFPFS
jgi:hypothetical protein